jgi:chemotaxis protein CheD
MSTLVEPARDVAVRIADLAVVAAPMRLTTSGLGSCIAIIVHDATARVGGLAHVLLPNPPGAASGHPAKFVNTAVPDLLARMRALGATEAITARLVGGARMFSALLPAGMPAVGDRNVAAAREALQHAGIPVVGEDVGGEFGRSVVLDVSAGTVCVQSFARDARLI